MNKAGVMTDWAYQPALHLQPVIKKIYGTKKGILPALLISLVVLSLPSLELSSENLEAKQTVPPTPKSEISLINLTVWSLETAR